MFTYLSQHGVHFHWHLWVHTAVGKNLVHSKRKQKPSFSPVNAAFCLKMGHAEEFITSINYICCEHSLDVYIIFQMIRGNDGIDLLIWMKQVWPFLLALKKSNSFPFFLFPLRKGKLLIRRLHRSLSWKKSHSVTASTHWLSESVRGSAVSDLFGGCNLTSWHSLALWTLAVALLHLSFILCLLLGLLPLAELHSLPIFNLKLISCLIKNHFTSTLSLGCVWVIRLRLASSHKQTKGLCNILLSFMYYQSPGVQILSLFSIDWWSSKWKASLWRNKGGNMM